MPLRPCLDCGLLSDQSRCSACRRRRNRSRDARRGGTKARGYAGGWLALARCILERDGYVCHWCGDRATTADHVIPKIRGGTDHPGNLVAACRPCNSGRTANVNRSGSFGTPRP